MPNGHVCSAVASLPPPERHMSAGSRKMHCLFTEVGEMHPVLVPTTLSKYTVIAMTISMSVLLLKIVRRVQSGVLPPRLSHVLHA
eukprot:SAG31_NODE_3212_length_4544_cov_1.849719_2_plen_85_part_00